MAEAHDKWAPSLLSWPYYLMTVHISYEPKGHGSLRRMFIRQSRRYPFLTQPYSQYSCDEAPLRSVQPPAKSSQGRATSERIGVCSLSCPRSHANSCRGDPGLKRSKETKPERGDAELGLTKTIAAKLLKPTSVDWT